MIEYLLKCQMEAELMEYKTFVVGFQSFTFPFIYGMLRPNLLDNIHYYLVLMSENSRDGLVFFYLNKKITKCLQTARF